MYMILRIYDSTRIHLLSCSAVELDPRLTSELGTPKSRSDPHPKRTKPVGQCHHHSLTIHPSGKLQNQKNTSAAHVYLGKSTTWQWKINHLSMVFSNMKLLQNPHLHELNLAMCWQLRKDTLTSKKGVLKTSEDGNLRGCWWLMIL